MRDKDYEIMMIEEQKEIDEFNINAYNESKRLDDYYEQQIDYEEGLMF